MGTNTMHYNLYDVIFYSLETEANLEDIIIIVYTYVDKQNIETQE